MSDPPGLKYSPDEPMLLSLLLLLLFPRMSRIPQLRFSPRLDESGKSQANSKLARVNKQRSLQNALCFNGDWKTRQPSLSSSKNKINTLEAFLTVWHSFTIKYFFWCVFFSESFWCNIKIPFPAFSPTRDQTFTFSANEYLFLPANPSKRCREPEWTPWKACLIHFSPFSIQASQGVFTWKRANYDHFQHTNDSCTSESHSRSDVPPAYKGMLISSLWGVQPVVLRFNSPRLLQRLFFFFFSCLR